MATKTLLVETLNQLSPEELDEFKSLIKLEKSFPLSSKSQVKVANTQELVDLMVETYRQESEEVTRKILNKMKRTDQLQRRPKQLSSGTKDQHHGDGGRPALVKKVETMVSDIELLLQTMANFTDKELRDFNHVLRSEIHHQRRHSDPSWRLFWMADLADIDFHRPLSDSSWTLLRKKHLELTVFLIFTFGEESVETTERILKTMKRTDLVQRLFDRSPGTTKKHPVDEHLSALIHKVATVAAVKEVILETLSGLSFEDLERFKWFLQLTCFHKGFPYISWRRLEGHSADRLSEVMVEMCGLQSVDVTREVLMDMNRTDVDQRLSEISSGLKEKYGRCSALIQKEGEMVSVTELLLKTLPDLSVRELRRFNQFLLRYLKRHSDVPWTLLMKTHLEDTVFLMVQTYGEESVEMTEKILEKMERTYLAERLFRSSGTTKKLSVDERCSALIQKVATMAAVKHLLLENLKDLHVEELQRFKEVLQLIHSPWRTSVSPWMLSSSDNMADVVDVIMETYGQQSVEVTKEVFMRINRTVKKHAWSAAWVSVVYKLSGNEYHTAQSERVAAKDALTHVLVETLKSLSLEDFNKFMWLLQFTYFRRGLPQLPLNQLMGADRAEIVTLMVERFGQRSVEVIKEVLTDMNRTDLPLSLSESSLQLRGDSRSLEVQGCGSTTQESSDWTKVEPEVNSTEADEASTYSLQSEGGRFECSVSALRCVCKEEVSLQYQFNSWEDHMERMESRQYMPAGPLMNITVNAGRLDEVYLPHWICIDEYPTVKDNFAVLHIDECGDVVEKVSEVTASHVKLSEPGFSPRAVLVKVGLPVKIACCVLLFYKPSTQFLKLHVYVIPKDPALQKAVEKKEITNQYKTIMKPHPNKYLRMKQDFSLTEDSNTAQILPKELTLRYDSQDPNFYEVFIENPERNVYLTLSYSSTNKGESVWTCEIRKDDYQSSGHLKVDECLPELIQKVTISGQSKVRERLLDTLVRLKEEEFKTFKWYLEDSDIPKSQVENSDMLGVVDLIVQTHSQQSVEVTKAIYKKINRNDLVEMLSGSSSGSTAAIITIIELPTPTSKLQLPEPNHDPIQQLSTLTNIDYVLSCPYSSEDHRS